LTAERNDPSATAQAADRTSAAAPPSKLQKDMVERAVEHFSLRARAADRSPRLLIDSQCNLLWQSSDAERLLQPPLPVRAVLLVQEEVAERIVAAPDSREYGALSVNVQAVARAEIVRSVPASAFTPPPKVESSVMRFTPLETPLVPLDELAEFRTFVQAAFGMRRKQLANILRSVRSLSLEEAAAVLAGQGIDPRARPETLSPSQLATLMRASRS